MAQNRSASHDDLLRDAAFPYRGMDDPNAHINHFRHLTSAAPQAVVGADGFVPTTFTASTLSVVSTSGNDTVAGLGAQTLILEGLDINNNVISESVDMNGATPVVTNQEFKHVNSGHTTAVGATGNGIGLITVTKGASVVGGIALGQNYIGTSAFMCPAGKKAFVGAVWCLPMATAVSRWSVLRIQNSDPATKRVIGQVLVPIFNSSVSMNALVAARFAELNAGDLAWVQVELATGTAMGTMAITLQDV